MVSPQNPLKATDGMARFGTRFALAKTVARHPRILVTDLELRLGTRFTSDTLGALRRYYPKTEFVWLMGADNLGEIHRWQRWRSIFDNVPIAVFDRPPFRLQTLSSPAASAYARARRDQSRSGQLPSFRPPAWVFFTSRLEPLSSTQLRMAARQFGPGALRSGHALPTLGKVHSQRGSLIDAQISQSQTGATFAPPVSDFKMLPRDPSPESLKDAITRSIDDDKGEDIVVIELTEKSLADFIVIASGRSSRQVGAMADHLIERLQPSLSYRLTVEGMPQGDWVLIDCGDVVVHLFRPEVRDFYALEKMWGLEPPGHAAAEKSSQSQP